MYIPKYFPNTDPKIIMNKRGKIYNKNIMNANKQ